MDEGECPDPDDQLENEHDGRRHDAEDVAAKTFSDAALAAFEGRSEGEFWQLLSRVLARRIADYWKKRESSPAASRTEAIAFA